jgi:glucosylceramidase
MKILRKTTNAILLNLLICNSLFSQVQWIGTIEKAPWRTCLAPVLQKYDGTNERLIEIFPAKKLQQIDGFGGCFNERGMDALSVLPGNKRLEVIQQLFDTVSGCKFNICRMPIGASDYAMDYYSLDDTPGDYKMEHFSIERDRKYLIPYIKMAMKYNPKLKIWGSPWTPPAWMKSNNHYSCQGMQDSCHLQWNPEILHAYALYFEKYIKAYRNEGVNVYAIHVQNEPYACQNFPSCLWTGDKMRDFIRDYLGPKLTGLNTEIWLGTINNGKYDDCAGVVLSDPGSAKYITGVGYQWDGKNAIGITAARHPGIKLMQTESECGGSENNLQSALYTYGLIDHYLKSGANSYMYWNMILDRSGLSSWGWPQNSLISINRNTREAAYNMEFYVMKHFAHFVKSGASRLVTSGYDENVLAFMNPGNELIVVVMNSSQFNKKYTVKIGDKMFIADLQGQSFNTFKID